MYLLAGDIGGTNSRLIYAEVNSLGKFTLLEKSYLSAEYQTFYDVLERFLSDDEISTPVDGVCLAVAGAVKSGSVSVTNLPWVITEDSLKERLRTPAVKLINDFTAVAYGLLDLGEKDFLTIQSGKTNNKVSRCENNTHQGAVIVGAGTGLGACHVINFNGNYMPLSSEAGHAGFAPQNKQQCALMLWLWETEKNISLESLLSGKGLFTIYQFFRDVEGVLESDSISRMLMVSDPAQVITDHALTDKDELCVKTLQMFINIYGAAAGDIVLHYYPVSKLYIGGGIAPKIKYAMLDGEFLKAFLNKGSMSSNMKEIEIKMVCQEKAGLLGALAQARNLCE